MLIKLKSVFNYVDTLYLGQHVDTQHPHKKEGLDTHPMCIQKTYMPPQINSVNKISFT